MRIDHTDYGLKPKHRVLEQFPIYSDQLPTCISNGSLTLKEGVKRFNGNVVTFDDDSEHAVDAVILCTGWKKCQMCRKKNKLSYQFMIFRLFDFIPIS